MCIWKTEHYLASQYKYIWIWISHSDQSAGAMNPEKRKQKYVCSLHTWSPSIHFSLRQRWVRWVPLYRTVQLRHTHTLTISSIRWSTSHATHSDWLRVNTSRGGMIASSRPGTYVHISSGQMGTNYRYNTQLHSFRRNLLIENQKRLLFHASFHASLSHRIDFLPIDQRYM